MYFRERPGDARERRRGPRGGRRRGSTPRFRSRAASRAATRARRRTPWGEARPERRRRRRRATRDWRRAPPPPPSPPAARLPARPWRPRARVAEPVVAHRALDGHVRARAATRRVVRGRGREGHSAGANRRGCVILRRSAVDAPGGAPAEPPERTRTLARAFPEGPTTTHVTRRDPQTLCPAAQGEGGRREPPLAPASGVYQRFLRALF